MPDSYERKISSEEAAEGYILVEKARLKLFPPIGEPFDLATAAGPERVRVEARDCDCRGPDKPHQHYFIRRQGLERGSRWRFTRGEGGYRMERAEVRA
jgi:hypothetical protein